MPWVFFWPHLSQNGCQSSRQLGNADGHKQKIVPRETRSAGTAQQDRKDPPGSTAAKHHVKNCALFHPPHIHQGQAGTSTLARLWWGPQLPPWDGVRGEQISDLDFRSYLERTKQHPQSQQRLWGAWTFTTPTWQWGGAPPPCSSGVKGGLVESKNFNHSPAVTLTLWCQWRLGGGGKEPGFYPLMAPMWWHFTSPLEWYQSKAAKTEDLNKI